MDKQALRAELKIRRARAAAQMPKAGEAAAMRAPAALFEAKPAVVAGYVPISHEMEPGSLLYRFRQNGAGLCLPVVGKPNTPMTFRAWDFGQPLKDGPFGTRHPVESAEELTPDVMIVPLLGWSQEGGRLGWGQGHYDRTLHALREAGHAPTTVGLGFEVQRVWGLPLEAHDAPMDWIVTESAAYEASRAETTPL